MVFEFGFLGAFESIKLVEGKIIAVVLGAGIDGDAFGDDGVGDGDHGRLTDGADDSGVNREGIWGRDRIDVLGGDLGEEISDHGGKKVAAAIEAFGDQRLLVGADDDFLVG